MGTLVEYSEVSEVCALEAQFQQATRSHDVRTLRQLLHWSAPIMSAGVHYTTQAIVSAHESRALCLTQFRVVGEILVSPLRGGHVASFRAVLKGTFEGRVCDGIYVYERLWRQTLRGWQVVSMKVTAQAS